MKEHMEKLRLKQAVEKPAIQQLSQHILKHLESVFSPADGVGNTAPTGQSNI